MKDVKKTFHWGIASSALQTEGASFLDGKGPSIWDEFSLRKGKIAGGHTPEIANSFYYRYEEDLDIVQSLHIPNFRFSISWPRVLPQGTRNINQKGIDYYDRLIDACLARGITPWVTLYHWDLPLQLELSGGWN
ncbi:MAG: family 1 glycosylhydrolase, partial [Bacteroidia bacterium]